MGAPLLEETLTLDSGPTGSCRPLGVKDEAENKAATFVNGCCCDADDAGDRLYSFSLRKKGF